MGTRNVKKHHTTSEEMALGAMPDVCLGGSCNRLQADGTSERNPDRDPLAEWIWNQGLTTFEVQIHPSTHGRGYDWDIDGPQEKKARERAKLRVYQIRHDVPSAVTIMEILDDARRGRESVVWFNGGTGFSLNGLGNRNEIRDSAVLKHYLPPVVNANLVAFANVGRQMRNELLEMVADAPNITIVDGDLEALKDVLEKKIQALKQPAEPAQDS